MEKARGYNLFIKNALKYGFSLFGLPKTGVSVSYNNYDDGYYKKGYPKSGAKFTNNGDGTITDNATGLMWVRDPSLLGGAFGVPGTPSKMKYLDSLSNVHALNYAGYSDWRVPNIKEMQSIFDYSRSYPAIDTDFFVIYDSSVYFNTSTRYACWLGALVAADLDNGFGYFSFVVELLYILPVRGGA